MIAVLIAMIRDWVQITFTAHTIRKNMNERKAQGWK